jgi:hypothetical protein
MVVGNRFLVNVSLDFGWAESDRQRKARNSGLRGREAREGARALPNARPRPRR